MNYYELSFTYTSPIEKEIINDVLAAELGEIGFESFTESEKGLLGYISEALYDKKTLDDKLVDFPLENTRIDDRILISMSKSHYTNQGIKDSKRLSVNLVSREILPKADYVGSVSGATVQSGPGASGRSHCVCSVPSY